MINNNKKKTKEIIYLSIILVFLAVNSIILNLNSNSTDHISDNSINSELILPDDIIKDQGIYYEDFTEEWLTNGNFSSATPAPWYNTTDKGDKTDIKASYGSGAASYEVLGYKGSYSIIANPLNSSWNILQNPDYKAFPEWNVDPYTAYGFDASGGWARHYWNEGPRQRPSVHFVKNITTPINLTDYEITSVKVSATVDATADSNIDVKDDSPPQGYEYDFVHFYVKIGKVSDLQREYYYTMADNKTTILGRNTGPLTMTNVYLKEKSYMDDNLEEVLTEDGQNFTLILGLDILCEDSRSTDTDIWTMLRMKYLNFTFTYEKMINKDTALSWNQVGDQISGSNIQIKDAKLNFKYIINETWSSSLSSNSELKVIINNTQHSETIKLTSAGTSYKDAKTGGFDVTNLIKKDVNIALSIQLFLADDFRLNRGFKISIDDVSLNITYTVSTTETPTQIQLFLNGADKTLDKSIEIPWRENINISVEYNNKSSGAFIPDAYVTLNGTGVSEILKDYGYNNYTVVINSTKLPFGNNYLTLNAEEMYYESIPPTTIKITVIDRPTFIDNILLNYTEQTSIEMQYNTILNISISYNDTLTKRFISGATVSINGSKSYPMPENNYNQYSVEINTTDLKSGLNFFTIRAQKENYSLTTEPITIAVNIKDAYLNVSVNNIPTTELESGYYSIPYGDLLNITAGYFEADSENFINEATVKLITTNKTDHLLTLTMPKNSDYNQYNITINSTIFGVNVRSLTISAQKANYTWISESFSVIVTERATQMQLWLNNTPREETTPTFEINVNQILNINVTYKESGKHLSEAEGTRVRIFGGGIDDNLTEILSLDQYFYSLNSSNLNSSINLINIFAEREGYQTQYKLITIMVKERNSSIELFLNLTDYTYISSFTYNLTIGDFLNITIKYKDWLTKTHIDGASVALEGENLNKELDEYKTIGQYSILLDSEELKQGVKFLTITAYKVNYQPRQKNIKIDIKDKAALFTLLVDGDNRTDDIVINLIWGNQLNLTVFYLKNDTSKQLIPGATVELRKVEGYTLLYSLIKHPIYAQYNRTFNTAELGIGTHSLLIITKKDYYTTITKYLILIISERNTNLSIFIDNKDVSSVNSFNYTLGEILNITAWYRDVNTTNLVYPGDVELSGLPGLPIPLSKHLQYNQYNLTICTNDIGLGTNFLQIIAQWENYTTRTKQIKITISEKIADIQVFLNNTPIAYNGNRTVEVIQTLNITVWFKDHDTQQHIPTATIELLGKGGGAFNESDYGFYNLTLNIIDLEQEGLANLNILLVKTDYKTQTFQFFLKVVQRQTNLDIFFNGLNYTLSPVLDLPMGALINLTINFTESTGLHIPGATVKLGSAYQANLTESNNLYTIIIDTSLLELGVNIISFEAYKSNFEIQIENIQITLRRISTKIETEDGEDKYEIRPGESITITVEVTEDEAANGFTAKIDDADVTYEWKLEDGDFEEEDDGVYEVTLENVPEGTYTITISVYKSGGKYDFEDLEITLVVKAPTEENLLFRILLIIAIIAGVALGSYLVVYQKYLKYPKAVRKVRKYRRTLKRKKSPSIEIISREKGFKELFSEKVGKANRYIKGKTPEETEPEDKFLKKESEDLAVEKSINEPEKDITKKSADY